MITENLSILKIHKLSQEQYDRELALGNIDDTALYLTPDDPDVVTPKMFGAKGDGETDDTAAIQAAIDSGSNVLITEGTYAIYGTIIISGNNIKFEKDNSGVITAYYDKSRIGEGFTDFGKTVRLQNNVRLTKPATATNDDPVVWIVGNRNSLIGEGMTNSFIISKRPTPLGALLVGDWGMNAVGVNTNYNTIANVGISGYTPGGIKPTGTNEVPESENKNPSLNLIDYIKNNEATDEFLTNLRKNQGEKADYFIKVDTANTLHKVIENIAENNPEEEVESEEEENESEDYTKPYNATKAVYLCCSDGYYYCSYFNTLQNLYIAKASSGLMLEGLSDANIIENLQFYGVGNEKKYHGAAIHLKRTETPRRHRYNPYLYELVTSDNVGNILAVYKKNNTILTVVVDENGNIVAQDENGNDVNANLSIDEEGNIVSTDSSGEITIEVNKEDRFTMSRQSYPLENTIANAFHHASRGADTLLFDGAILLNSIQNIISEQGDIKDADGNYLIKSRCFRVKRDPLSRCQGNNILIIDNCIGGNSIPDGFYERNTVQRRGFINSRNIQTLNLTTYDLTSRNNIRINDGAQVNERSFLIQNVKEYYEDDVVYPDGYPDNGGIPTYPIGTNYNLFDLKIIPFLGKTITVDVDLRFGAPSLTYAATSKQGTARFLIVVDGSGNVSVKTLYAYSDVAVFNEPVVYNIIAKDDNGNVIMDDEGNPKASPHCLFSVFFRRHTTTNTSNNSIYCDYRIFGYENMWSVTEYTTATKVNETELKEDYGVEIKQIQPCVAQTTQSATTENRPESPMIGQQYFDTTLGSPMWYNGSKWVGTTHNRISENTQVDERSFFVPNVFEWIGEPETKKDSDGNVMTDTNGEPMLIYPDGADYKLFSLKVNTNSFTGRTITVDVDLRFYAQYLTHAAMSKQGTARFLIVVDGLGNASLKTVYANSDVAMFNEPVIIKTGETEWNCIFSAFFRRHTTNNTNRNGIYCDYRIFGHEGMYEVTEHTEAEQMVDGNIKRIEPCAFLTSKNGVAENRPESPMVGQQYFDTTLGKPIWYNGTNWVDSTGANVDATETTDV